jgi:hypothetical protein
VARDGAAKRLVPLAKSWISPPETKLSVPGEGTVEYDPAQRAFVLHRKADAVRGPFTVMIESSADRPLVNPAFVIDAEVLPTKVRVWMDGKEAQVRVRMGMEHHLEGDQAVIFLEMTATAPAEIQIEETARH